MTWESTSPWVTGLGDNLAADSTRSGLATLVKAAGAVGLGARWSLFFPSGDVEEIGAECCEDFGTEVGVGGAGLSEDLEVLLLAAAAGIIFSAEG
jgi:hypothetical protein